MANGKLRVRRNGKPIWIADKDLQDGDEIIPMFGRGEKPAMTEPAKTASDADVMAILEKMQADMAALRNQNEELERSLRSKNEEMEKRLKAAARAKSGKPVRTKPEPIHPKDGSAYPVPFYNPYALDETFAAVPDRPVRPGERMEYHVFRNGLFVAQNEEDERVVTAALRAWGPDAPRNWRGDDRPESLVCDRCGFRTANYNAIADHERRFVDHRLRPIT